MRRLVQWLGLVALLPVVYLFAALAGAILPAPVSPDRGGPPEITVGLIRGPIHYDFLVPSTNRTRDVFQFAHRAGVPLAHPDVRWILVGWGARDFYTTVGGYSDVSFRALWRGATGDDAVLRVDVLGTLPATAPGLRWLNLSNAQFDRLIAALEQEARAAEPIDHDGFSENDAFFTARGPFHLFRTCNVWVGEMLAQAGIAIGRWTPIPHSVDLSLRWFRVPQGG